MILLVTNRRDVTTDFVVAEMVRRGHPFHRFNTDVADEADLAFTIGDGGAIWSLMVDGERIGADVFTAGFFRRPALPDSISKIGAAFVDHVSGEWAATLNSFYAALTCKWLSNPRSIAMAEDKPRQLTLAHRLGFNVPATLLAATYREVVSFVAGAPSVAKPISSGRLTTGEAEQIAFTSRIAVIGPGDEDAIAVSPVIYQHEVDKVCDLRVTVVGERVFACEIHQDDTRDVDWRKKDITSLSYQPVQLPEPIASRCQELVRTLDLGFGAIDLVRDYQGEYWFLEINPNGQWAWIEHQTHLPIAAAIVDLLVERAAQ